MRILKYSHPLAQNYWANKKQLWGKFSCPDELVLMEPKDLLIFDENLIHSGVGYIDQPGRDGLINWRIFTYANSNSKLRHIHPANDGVYTYAARMSSDDRKEDGRGARDFFAHVLPKITKL